MPKRLFSLALLLCILLCGCRRQTAPAQIQPASLSEETEQILQLLGDEVLFCDYTAPDGAQSFSLELWATERAGWASCGRVTGEIPAPEGRLGARLADGRCDLFVSDSSGYSKSSYHLPAPEGISSRCASRLDHPVEIPLEEEIPLLVTLASRNAGQPLSAPLANFREAACDWGLAVTVSFLAQPAA